MVAQDNNGTWLPRWYIFRQDVRRRLCFKFIGNMFGFVVEITTEETPVCESKSERLRWDDFVVNQLRSSSSGGDVCHDQLYRDDSSDGSVAGMAPAGEHCGNSRSVSN